MNRSASAFFAAVFAAATLLAAQPVHADPMKCSGEEKTCSSACVKAARSQLSVCLTACGVRKSKCMKTGCWDTGSKIYCGLSKL